MKVTDKQIERAMDSFLHTAAVMDGRDEYGDFLLGYLAGLGNEDCEDENMRVRSLAFRVGWNEGWVGRQWGVESP